MDGGRQGAVPSPNQGFNAMEMLTSRLAGVVLCAVFLLPVARASELFQFELRGEGFHWYNAWECPDTVCPSEGYAFLWTGTVDVETSSAADGLYTGSDLLSLNFRSNRGDFFASGSDRYPVGPASATVSGGQIISLDVFVDDYFSRYRISGLSADYEFGGCHHCGVEYASGLMTPLVPVPEPSTWALMGTGLFAVGAGAVLRRRTSR